MCGIIGYIGNKKVVPILINGLKSMEYRGYDSSGMCVKNNETLKAVKRKGKVSELAESKELFELDGFSGIAHTRWATHGEPNEINSHPHFDCSKSVAIVHNGIIENYASLREVLKNEGHKFISQTDSEVIAHLIEKFYKKELIEAVIKALELVEGTFGLLVINQLENKIIAAKRGSPLILGVGENEMFAASDVAALIKHTNKIVYLKDNEIAELSGESYIIKNFLGIPVENEVHEVQLKAEQIEKGEHKHFMLKEIFEQPEAIRNALRGRLNNSLVKISTSIDLSILRRVVIVGCGTSWHSALIGKYLIENIAGIPTEVDYASEFRYRNPIICQGDLVIVISQSGETADALAALKEAKLRGAQTFGIVNVVGSSIAREVDSGMFLHAGLEIGVASTKAFTSQIVNILLFALYLRQKTKPASPMSILGELESLPEKVKLTLELNEKIKKIAEKFKDSENFIYLGRGLNFPVALEGALKLKEISYVHAEGYPAAEMKHGPIALVDENLPVIFIAPRDSTYEKIVSNMQEVKARKGKIIAIVSKDDENIRNIVDEIIVVPETSEELMPILNTIVLQLFAYHIANLKNFDVDKPRNLAKSVTVE